MAPKYCQKRKLQRKANKNNQNLSEEKRNKKREYARNTGSFL